MQMFAVEQVSPNFRPAYRVRIARYVLASCNLNCTLNRQRALQPRLRIVARMTERLQIRFVEQFSLW